MSDEVVKPVEDQIIEPPSEDMDILIHDLGNLLMVALGNLKVLAKRIESGKEQTPEEVLSRVKKSIECLDKINSRVNQERVKRASS